MRLYGFVYFYNIAYNQATTTSTSNCVHVFVWNLMMPQTYTIEQQKRERNATKNDEGDKAMDINSTMRIGFRILRMSVREKPLRKVRHGNFYVRTRFVVYESFSALCIQGAVGRDGADTG